MENYQKAHEIINNKEQNTQGLRVLKETTLNIKNILEEIITDETLTEEEKNFFNELQNPEEIKGIAKNIISELCKRICNGENPSRKLFDDVCLKVIGIEGGIYPGYTKALLKQLPDWKNIVDSFQYDNPNPNKDIEEFRKKRKE